MYAGHLGFALGAHGFRRSVPLWLLILASQLPDLADAASCISGVRPATPGMFTHSLPAVALLATVFALSYYGASRDTSGMVLVFAIVMSHLVGDYVTGIKPTWPSGPMIGLQLYRLPAVDFVIESLTIVAGWAIYRRTFPPARRWARDVVAIPVVLILIQLVADIVFIAVPTIKKC